jgi:hypothetical protein
MSKSKIAFTLPEDITLRELEAYEKKVRELLPADGTLTDASFMRAVVSGAVAAGFLRGEGVPKDLDGASVRVIVVLADAVGKLIAAVKTIDPNS